MTDKKKTTKVDLEKKVSDLDLRVSQLESLTKRLVSKAHMCLNCKRYEVGNCTDTNRAVSEFDECSMFTRM